MHHSSFTPIRVGIFFGGQSREREISFAGGRTVYDHLDRKRFEPVPVFVDSLGNFILLHPQYLYQGTIREFYPPAAKANFWGIPLYIESLPENDEPLSEKIGRKIAPPDFSKYFDMAFLCLHGPYGEDGTIQGLLAWYQIPYTGSDLLPAALGIDKIFQQKLLGKAGFLVPPAFILTQKEWLHTDDKSKLLDQITVAIGLPFVVKSSKQGSSIGVTIVQHPPALSRNAIANGNFGIETGLCSSHTAEYASVLDCASPKNASSQIALEKELLHAFIAAVHKAFFIETLSYDSWKSYTPADKKDWFNNLIDLRQGIGFPLLVADQIFYTPHALLDYIEGYFQKQQDPILLISAQAEEAIIIEAFIAGREFSCIVLEAEKDNPIALPPTEILKGERHFDYKAKYLPGMVRKETPMAVSAPLLDAIRKEATALFQLLGCQVYARIDGFLTKDNQVILNDPNTTAGMNPASFLFDQAAEIGLHPTQLLTFIIKRSLAVRKDKGYLTAGSLLKRLEASH